MNWHTIVINFLLAIHVLVALLIILLVLMQRPKNEGLGAAFGGGMTENLFGAQTTNVLQTITRYLGGIFFALTLLLSFLYVKKSAGGSGSLQRSLSAPTTIPAATPAPDAVPSIPTGVAYDPVKPVPATPAPAPEAAKSEAAPDAPKAGSVPETPKTEPMPESAAPVPSAPPVPTSAPPASEPAPAPVLPEPAPAKPEPAPAPAPAAPEAAPAPAPAENPAN